MCVSTSDFDTVKIYVQFFGPINPESKKGSATMNRCTAEVFEAVNKLTVCRLPMGASLLGLP